MTRRNKTYLRLQSLPWLLNEMHSGRLVVPAYQRHFVWSRAQVKLLLESIYHGYPIGAILLLESQTQQWPVLKPEQSEFPIPKKSDFSSASPTWYVIDGSQRLAALYNSFFGSKPKFSFAFDLKDQEFIAGKGVTQSDPRFLNLRELFSTEASSKALAKFHGVKDSNLLFDNYRDLHTAFADYELVVHIFIDMPLWEVMEVYERLNSAGRKLNKRDLEQAKREFDNN